MGRLMDPQPWRRDHQFGTNGHPRYGDTSLSQEGQRGWDERIGDLHYHSFNGCRNAAGPFSNQSGGLFGFWFRQITTEAGLPIPDSHIAVVSIPSRQVAIAPGILHAQTVLS
jgi:hypothetical protein